MSVNPPATVTNLLINTLASNKIVFLPAASTMSGHLYTIKDICGNAAASSIFVSTVGLDTIDSIATRAILSTTFGGVTMASDGRTNWMVLQHKIFNSFFTPSQISGLQVWLDAMDTNTLSLSGNNVTQWNNKTGNNNATSPSGTIQINQAFINGRTSVRFGTSSFLTISSLNYVSEFKYVFAVLTIGSITTADTQNYLFINGGTTATIQFYTYGGELQMNRSGALVIQCTNPTNFFGTTSIVAVGNSVGNRGLTINGTSQTISVTTANFTTGTVSQSIGGSTNAVDIAELIIIDGAVSVTQRQQIEGYLAWKWGLQANLSTNHPFRRTRP